ncbi:DUF406 family protein (plasmid) [Photobacterium sp. GJ3]|uniref:DUF406 family protein n=1 Tax=Photobacterium sp. GJ3 TaxID=2829502 RepID=UPI001B8C64CE|nr:DUF406 family protein [Photobacterium sp. GJ3]QUJ69284.1 DUF406 family protein [Photobacterium sp. GJ3]
MADLKHLEAPCEACGVAAEIGFLIREGDDVSELDFRGEHRVAIESEFEPYLRLAQSVNAAVQHECLFLANDTEMKARLHFECSAEKIIFDLKSRALS